MNASDEISLKTMIKRNKTCSNQGRPCSNQTPDLGPCSYKNGFIKEKFKCIQKT